MADARVTDTSMAAWLTLGSVSLLFFLVTALTFSSLGVVLPAMMGELKLSGSAAGLGFTLLGVFTGITSTVPAMPARPVESAKAPTLI